MKIVPFVLLVWLNAMSQTSVAVMEFEGKGVSKQEASALTDRFRDELFKSGRFQVMERAYMEQILKEQGFQMSGCTSNECMVEVGQLVAVEQIVGGSISKVGEIYSVSARVISVESGKILSVSIYDFRGNISALMTEGMHNVVLQLTSGRITTQPKTQSNSSIYVTSMPSAAAIYIDGNKINGITPFMIDNLVAGEHRLILQQGNFTADTTLNLEPDDVKKIHLVLKKGYGRMKVVTTPFEAKVYIDGIEKGTTPTVIRHIIAGVHQLKVAKEGYLPAEMTVGVNYNEVKDIQLILKKPVLLSLVCTLDSVEFRLGEKYSGIAPATLTVEDGKYRLTCTKPDYYPFETDLVLKEGETRDVSINLKRQVGALEIISVPSEAEVTLNGSRIGLTPYQTTKLPTGVYSINLTQGNFLLDTTITIFADVTNKYGFSLRKGYGNLEILTNPSGANVFIDDIERGISPLLIENLPAGIYQVKVKKVGCSESVASVNVTPRETQSSTLFLEKLSLLNIESDQDSVYIFLNNLNLGFAPIAIHLDSGQYFIDVYKNGYSSFHDNFYLKSNTDQKLSLNLTKGSLLSAYPSSEKRKGVKGEKGSFPIRRGDIWFGIGPSYYVDDFFGFGVITGISLTEHLTIGLKYNYWERTEYEEDVRINDLSMEVKHLIAFKKLFTPKINAIPFMKYSVNAMVVKDYYYWDEYTNEHIGIGLGCGWDILVFQRFGVSYDMNYQYNFIGFHSYSSVTFSATLFFVLHYFYRR